MKRAKVSSVYEGRVSKASKQEKDAKSREARQNARARMNIQRRRMVTRSMAASMPEKEVISLKKGEQHHNDVLSPTGDGVKVEERNQKLLGDALEEEKEKEEKKNEDVAAGSQIVIEEEETPLRCNMEPEWIWAGWAEGWEWKWTYNQMIMNGKIWFGVEDYLDDEGLDWKDDLWNLRGTKGPPKF